MNLGDVNMTQPKREAGAAVTAVGWGVGGVHESGCPPQVSSDLTDDVGDEVG